MLHVSRKYKLQMNALHTSFDVFKNDYAARQKKLFKEFNNG